MKFKEGHKKVGGRKPGSKNDRHGPLLEKFLDGWLNSKTQAEFNAMADADPAKFAALAEKRLARKVELSGPDNGPIEVKWMGE